MKYTTKDLVLRATQLADLENSDFISYNENIQLLNETYQKVYQKLINHGDKSFLKRIVHPRVDTLSDLPDNAIAYILPPDFYQLASVTHSKVKLPILRRSKNQTPQSLAYELVNDELIIYRGSDIQDLEICYYPVPQSLYLPAPEKSFPAIPSSVASSIYTIRHGIVAFKSGTYGAVWDPETGNTFTSTASNPTAAFILSSTVVAFYASQHFYLYDILEQTTTDYEGQLLLSSESGSFYIFNVENPGEFDVYKSDGDAQFYPIGKVYGNAFLVNNLIPFGFAKSATSEDLSEVLIFQNYEDPFGESLDGDFLVSYPVSMLPLEDADDVEYYGTPLYPVIGTPREPFYSSTGSVLFIDKSGVKLDGNVTIPSAFHPTYINDVNYDTGYGAIAKSKTGFTEISTFGSTVLNFPQNFYYTYLAYSLAVNYGIKQGKDVTNLVGLLQDAENVFYDTLERDDNSPVRIANVYRR